MCGIVGFASHTGELPGEWLTSGRDALSHRGPDGAGEWRSSDRRVGFGHRRLAIVDLTSAGDQPMLDERGELCIVFNGEIYNFQGLREELRAAGHRFTSQSDTEVILAAYRRWGADCLARLHGMFALALYDMPRRRLLLARDRAGEKPLFYRRESEGLRFSSELKGLLVDRSLPRKLDWTALDCYLADGYVPADKCILEGFAKLPPAHALLFDVGSGSVRLWRYWEPPALSPASVADASIDELASELETLLEGAVRRQLVADVPVGVLLSGGLDSSIVTALAARAIPALKTFTVRFPGFGDYDETQHARLIAQCFGADHVEIEAQAADANVLQTLARQFDEPMIDSSMLPTHLVSQVVRRHCTVALGGDGGDELFAGYPHYDRMLRMQRTFGAAPQSLRAALSSLAGKWLPPGLRGRNWLQALDVDFHTQAPAVLQMFDRVTRKRLMRSQPRWQEVAEGMRLMPKHGDDLLQRATRLDFQTYLPEDLLVKIDRAAMLNSLEIRAPMLDVAVMEFAFGRVPSHFKATASSRKVLLKKLAERILPPAFDSARKRGFSIPLSAWLQAGEWRTFFRDVLLDARADWFDRRLVENMIDTERHNKSNSERLFGLVMFELWRREYEIEM